MTFLFLELLIFWRKRSTTLIPAAHLLSKPRNFFPPISFARVVESRHTPFRSNHVPSLLPFHSSNNAIMRRIRSQPYACGHKVELGRMPDIPNCRGVCEGLNAQDEVLSVCAPCGLANFSSAVRNIVSGPLSLHIAPPFPPRRPS